MATIKAETKEIKNALRRHRGAMKQVCERARCSREMVRMVLNGQRTSARILAICAEVALEKEKEAEEIRAKVRSISRELQSYSVAAMAM